jgi:hypothetical protein
MSVLQEKIPHKTHKRCMGIYWAIPGKNWGELGKSSWCTHSIPNVPVDEILGFFNILILLKVT